MAICFCELYNIWNILIGMIPAMIIVLVFVMIPIWLYNYIKFRRDGIMELVEELKIQE